MDDIISLAIAAEQSKIAKEAVTAAWAGAVANFLVVLVTAAIAIQAQRAATLMRRETQAERLRIVLAELTAVAVDYSSTWETYLWNEGELAHLHLAARAFDGMRANIERALSREIPDAELHLLALRLRVTIVESVEKVRVLLDSSAGDLTCDELIDFPSTNDQIRTQIDHHTAVLKAAHERLRVKA